MWYKYFSKQSWNLRVWRKANLFFNQDDVGMFKAKGLLRWKDFIFRLARTEVALRGFNFFFLFGVLKSVAYAKSTYYDPTFVEPKKVEAEKELENHVIIQNLMIRLMKFYSKTESGPHLDHTEIQMIYQCFWQGYSKTYEQLADFLSYDQAMDVNMDQQKGLDSWMSVQDRRMLKYYQKSLGRKVDL